MGISQGNIIEPLPPPQLCSICLNKYQRTRPSICTCNHCVLSSCSDCMTDHNNERPQNVAKLSHQLHELEQLYLTKQKMVENEIFKSTEETGRCFTTYNSDLWTARQTISANIKNAKEDAEKYLNQVNSELQIIDSDIKTLAKETVCQPQRMEALFTQLNEIQQMLETYKITKEEAKLEIVIPKYTLKFHRVDPSAVDTNETSSSEPSSPQDNSTTRPTSRHKFHPYKKTITSPNRTKDRPSQTDQSNNN